MTKGNDWVCFCVSRSRHQQEGWSIQAPWTASNSCTESLGLEESTKAPRWLSWEVLFHSKPETKITSKHPVFRFPVNKQRYCLILWILHCSFVTAGAFLHFLARFHHLQIRRISAQMWPRVHENRESFLEIFVSRAREVKYSTWCLF